MWLVGWLVVESASDGIHVIIASSLSNNDTAAPDVSSKFLCCLYLLDRYSRQVAYIRTLY
jgi:hypothetical protein